MARIRIDQSISLDGYSAGPDQGPGQLLGAGGEQLHEWLFPAGDGPATTDDRRVGDEFGAGVGAFVMGRNMFAGGPGPWPTDPEWDGPWGTSPPFHAPVFVLTHHARAPLQLHDTTFHFVTDGPERALALARDVADGQDVRVCGGAHTIATYLAMGVVDELQLNVVPVLLGGGERPFEGVDPGTLGFTIDRVVATDAATHVRYRVHRAD